jgi:hypothetical protein
MSTHPVPPDPDAEAEVDLGRYVARIASLWWLPLLGLVLGAVLGYFVSLGGEQVYRAQALVYLGQPFSPGGAGRIDTLGTSAAAVREIVTSEAAVRRAASESGLRPARLRQGITVQGMGGPPRTVQASLVNIGVRGEAPRRVAQAANVLADELVRQASPYVDAKIATLRRQIEIADEELVSLDRRIEASLAAAEDESAPATERQLALLNLGFLESRRSGVQQSRLSNQQLLTLAQSEEEPRVLQPAVAQEVTARSRRNAIVVAATIGLLLGLVAALAWEPLAPRVRRAA